MGELNAIPFFKQFTVSNTEQCKSLACRPARHRWREPG